MNSDISDEDFMIHVLNNLPSKYEVQVSKLEDRLGSTTNPLTIEDLRDELNLKFARMKSTREGARTAASMDMGPVSVGSARRKRTTMMIKAIRSRASPQTSST